MKVRIQNFLRISSLVSLLIISVISFVFADGWLLAIVNNEAITQNDLDDFINFMRMQMSAQYSEQEIEQKIENMLPDLMDRLIEDRLILQAAYKEGIIIDQNRVKSRIAQIKSTYQSDADFQEALITQGLSLSDIELKIKEQLLMMEIINIKVKSKVALKPQEITDYYNKHSEDFNNPEQREVRFLTIRDSALAEQIQGAIIEYEDLDAIAKQHSLEITELGWVNSKQLSQEVRDVVFGLDIGKPSLPLGSDDNFYIFEVKAIRPVKLLSLFDVQEGIQYLLLEKKMQEALVAWLEELKSEAYIEIKDTSVLESGIKEN